MASGSMRSPAPSALLDRAAAPLSVSSPVSSSPLLPSADDETLAKRGKGSHRGKGKGRDHGSGRQGKGKHRKRRQQQKPGDRKRSRPQAPCYTGSPCTVGPKKNLTKCDLARSPAFKGKSCTKCNLSDANLSGADATGANLSNANLQQACLVDADLTGANLNGANTQRRHLLPHDDAERLRQQQRLRQRDDLLPHLRCRPPLPHGARLLQRRLQARQLLCGRGLPRPGVPHQDLPEPAVPLHVSNQWHGRTVCCPLLPWRLLRRGPVVL